VLHRFKNRCRLAAASFFAVVLAACSPPAEQPLLSQFFAASRLRDLTALATLSTVVFEPTTNGTVTTFTMTSVSPERQDGGRRMKDVTIDAPVRLPSGQTVAKTLVITLQRAEPGNGKPDVDRWIVTGFREASPAAATPRS
jgi:hypothetical protein